LVFLTTDPSEHHQRSELLDLSLDNAEILRQTEQLCRTTGAWQPVEEWRAQLARRLADDQARIR
jgi:hypothetical protein